ncbi:MAG: molybdopterin-dependent oxidoreductase [Bauldia sp.]
MSTPGVRTTCPYCGVGCGILASVGEGGSVSVAGDSEHPANAGRLCSKGLALPETLGANDRLLHPMVRGQRTTWDAALDAAASGIADTIARHGADAVAFYVSGQLLTEDYYVANKLMKGFIGSANIDTNSRLCMASSVAGHRRAFGADVVPGCYEDLELADLVVLVGSNLAWCHPVLFQRLLAAKERRPALRTVTIDPRRSPTAELSDLHLPIAPDEDVALFAGLLAHLDEAGAIDRDYIAVHTGGYHDALAAARGLDLDTVAQRTRIAPEALLRFYEWFAATPRTVTVYSQGVNQSAFGTDKVNAILNCHLATGRIGKPGSGPFSVTGQPNAMGGREVGGLANQLAAHLDLEDPKHRDLVRGIWRSPTIASRPGLKAVDLFHAVGEGRIKALWIMATNPVVSLPEADRVKDALIRCPLVIVSEVVAENDTLPLADIALPAAAWGEKDGTVTNSERRISRQRSFLAPPGEAKPDWWIVCEVAKRMGFGDAFAYTQPAEIFREHAALTALASRSAAPLDLSAFATLTPEAYADLSPTQWPVRAGEPVGPARLFGDGRFATPDGRARFVAVPAAAARSASSALTLNTGRVRDHWHTMTRTGRSARLSAHTAEPFVEISPDDAAAAGIAPASLVRVTSASGEVLLRARVTHAQRAGSVFAPMHWTDRFAAQARIGGLIPPSVDPISGQPALKQGRVAIAAAPMSWYGFAVIPRRPAAIAAEYWALAPIANGYRLELADSRPLTHPAGLAADLLGEVSPSSDELSVADPLAGRYRYARFTSGRFDGALFLSPAPVAVDRSWLVSLAGTSTSNAHRILAGRPAGDQLDEGSVVCSCFGVGAKRIGRAVAAGARDLGAIGASTQAGTNCGSCRAELNRLLSDAVAGKREG